VDVSEPKLGCAVAAADVEPATPALGLNEVILTVSANVIAMSITAGLSEQESAAELTSVKVYLTHSGLAGFELWFLMPCQYVGERD